MPKSSYQRNHPYPLADASGLCNKDGSQIYQKNILRSMNESRIKKFMDDKLGGEGSINAVPHHAKHPVKLFICTGKSGYGNDARFYQMVSE
jgi:hypothetical protein